MRYTHGLLFLKIRTGKRTDLAEPSSLARGVERDAHALPPSPPGAAGAVDVRLRVHTAALVGGGFGVEDEIDDHVQSSGGHIRRHENLEETKKKRMYERSL